MKSIKARWFHEGRRKPVRLVVVHDMEAPEKATTAEAVARYFSRTDTQASAHVCVDNDSAVRCVPDNWTAWAAPGANSDGLQIELAGYARQSRAEWLDPYSKATLVQAAKQAAAWCKKYGIPVRHLSVSELKAGKKGFIGHIDASNAYHGSDHHDPGEGFPWSTFLGLVRDVMNGEDVDQPKPKPVPMPDGVPTFVRPLKVYDPPMKGDDVKDWQERMVKRGKGLDVDGVYGKQSEGVCKSFQRGVTLPVTGVVDAATWLQTWTWEPPVDPTST